MGLDEFATRLLGETRDEITRADTKASILLAGAGVAVAAGAGAFASSDLTLAGARGLVQVLLVAAAALLILGIGALGTAVFPRIGRPTPGAAHYFRDHGQHDLAALRTVVESYASDTADRDLNQLLALSPIVEKKYRWTQAGELLLAAGIVASAAALLFHVVMCR